MHTYLPFFVYVPIAAFFLSWWFDRTQEKAIAGIAIGTFVMQLLGVSAFILGWLGAASQTLELKHWTLYESPHFTFFLDFYFDVTAAVFAFVGAAITLLAAVFSRFYMHRDDGFKRFFCTLLLFFIGYNFVVFSGNFETLFIGWEILGITSFLLISHYRDRYLPVKNGLKVLSLYRVGDVALILAMWLAHHVFHRNITFVELVDHSLIAATMPQHATALVVMAGLIVFAVVIKSAQFPFSSWLPRAMEGPTTSSAIFYGALSVHLGVFLLLRTYPLWQDMQAIKCALIVIGAVTALVATNIARVQATAKTQIAYATIAQIGLMLIELALGWHTLALIHFVGHAFLRCYQLLVTPSMLGYMIHNQFFEYEPNPQPQRSGALKTLYSTLYMLALKEWNLDTWQFKYLWQPFKWLGTKLQGLQRGAGLSLMLVVLVLLGLSAINVVSVAPKGASSLVAGGMALLLILCAFASRGEAVRTWWLVVLSQVCVALSIALNGIALNAAPAAKEIAMFLGSPLVFGLLGHIALRATHNIDADTALNRFHGYALEKPRMALLFLVSALGLLGFPFTPTFIGIDLMFTYIHDHQYGLLALIALGFVLLEITVLRIYARVFCGLHKKLTHPVVYRSS